MRIIQIFGNEEDRLVCFRMGGHEKGNQSWFDKEKKIMIYCQVSEIKNYNFEIYLNYLQYLLNQKIL